MRGGDSGPGAGFGGDSGPGTECAGIQAWARGGDSDSGRGVWIRAPGARWDGDSGPGAGWELFGGKMGNFLPFCRFFAV